MGLDSSIYKREGGDEKEVLYLRKVNAIHGYIVERFADGKDECQKIPLTIEDISKLRSLCGRILAGAKTERKVCVDGGKIWGSDSADGELTLVSWEDLAIRVLGKKKAEELEVGDRIRVHDSAFKVLSVVKLPDKGIVKYEAESEQVMSVMTNPEMAKKYLPTKEGFFFGSYGYDEFYLQGLEEYIRQADEIIQDYNEASGKDEISYYYQASW